MVRIEDYLDNTYTVEYLLLEELDKQRVLVVLHRMSGHAGPVDQPFLGREVQLFCSAVSRY